MNILLLLAHPDPGSFNHALAAAAETVLREAGHTVRRHDLYAERFEPLLPAEEFSRSATLSAEVERHCRELAEADGIIIVHPNWWGMPPAILTGWVDRVVRPGVAYEFIEGDSGEGVPRGLLKARSVLVLNTSNTVAEREERVFGDPLEAIWKKCVFDLCGVTDFHRRMFRVVVTATAEQRREWLKEAAELAGRLFPPTP